ncbi:MAG: hypothetical protein IIC78_00855 [Chloroflexi bacterium]|nr:hypothetical protein [Chloroflexota bacterium]
MSEKSATRSLPLQILAYLLAGLAILSLPIGVFANQTLRAILSSDVVAEVLSDVLIPGGSARDFLVNGLLSSDRIDTVQTLLFENLNQAERDEIIEIFVPDGWVEAQLKSAVVEFLSWIESDRARLNFVLDLTVIKDDLQNGGASRVIEIVFESAPTCTLAQFNVWQAALRADNLPQSGICVPEGDVVLPYRALVERLVLQQIREIPSKLTISDALGENQDLIKLKNAIVSFLDLLRILRLLPILFFGLLMTIAIRSMNQLGRWWGFPLILGSILGLMFVLLMIAFAPALLERTRVLSDAPIAVRDVLQRGTQSILLNVLKAAAFQYIAGLLFGALLYGITRIWKKQPKAEVAPANAEVEKEPFPSPPPLKPFRPDNAPESEDDETPSGIFD